MKAHWANVDFDEMGQKPLRFTPIDVEMIKKLGSQLPLPCNTPH